MILDETRYKTYNANLLAIVGAFKTWRHYLEGCKHEVFVLTEHNNLCQFMDTKSLISHQVSLSGLSTSAKLSPLHRVLICGTYVLSQLRQFWETFRTELADKNPYKASISGVRLRLSELQKLDPEAWKISAEDLEQYEEVDEVLHQQRLPFVPEIIWTELISRHHNDPLAEHFGFYLLAESQKRCRGLRQRLQLLFGFESGAA